MPVQLHNVCTLIDLVINFCGTQVACMSCWHWQPASLFSTAQWLSACVWHCNSIPFHSADAFSLRMALANQSAESQFSHAASIFLVLGKMTAWWLLIIINLVRK
mmetsp:Transcript_36724/g.108292  ORF Transcript_36724/g.108292 Transcript_36724/m.108292 type:complete len:104 (+) Transcript_36724:166-477(+)|eukprot:355993-Chlamydomonas_euryale.AAC.13